MRAEPQVGDREHFVFLLNGAGDDIAELTPAEALTLADELTRAAEPPQVCRTCHDRNASHGDWCSVCVPDDLDRPVPA